MNDELIEASDIDRTHGLDKKTFIYTNKREHLSIYLSDVHMNWAILALHRQLYHKC